MFYCVILKVFRCVFLNYWVVGTAHAYKVSNPLLGIGLVGYSCWLRAGQSSLLSLAGSLFFCFVSAFFFFFTFSVILCSLVPFTLLKS